MDRLTRAVLRGTGSCVPDRVVPNEEFAETLDTSDEWIRTRTGIRERRFAGVADTAATLGAEAARRALDAAGVSAQDVDLIVCATVTPDLMCPSTACLVQAALGCRPIPAFDVSAACSGFIYALSVAEQYVRTGTAKTALVIGTDVLSRVSDFADRNTCILFGDGAGAAVLGPAPDRSVGLHKVQLFADGTRQELIQVPSMVTPNPPPGTGTLPQLRYLRMHGREVFKFAVYQMIELVEQAQQDCRKLERELALIIPHQVNSRIIDAALDALELPADKVMVNLDKYGNTSAASVPIALDEAIRTGRVKPGDTVLLVAFGGGLTWSSALLTL
ncbi:MAG TPA: beta-ketoacyl-ACP synthase III [Fimbriiglobus sp.]|nr:beta-ketoacyl-ACP synthase III [Fimbriiglobus sp.]